MFGLDLFYRGRGFAKEAQQVFDVALVSANGAAFQGVEHFAFVLFPQGGKGGDPGDGVAAFQLQLGPFLDGYDVILAERYFLARFAPAVVVVPGLFAADSGPHAGWEITCHVSIRRGAILAIFDYVRGVVLPVLSGRR